MNLFDFFLVVILFTLSLIYLFAYFLFRRFVKKYIYLPKEVEVNSNKEIPIIATNLDKPAEWQRGYAAFWADKSFEYNPHMRVSKEFQDWAEGWTVAYHQSTVIGEN